MGNLQCTEPRARSPDLLAWGAAKILAILYNYKEGRKRASITPLSRFHTILNVVKFDNNGATKCK